jgi:hypothetical protein
MVKLLPECSKCGSPVTDSLETEIEQQGKVKTGNYTNERWICHDCIENEEAKKKNGTRTGDSPSKGLQVHQMYRQILLGQMGHEIIITQIRYFPSWL